MLSYLSLSSKDGCATTGAESSSLSCVFFAASPDKGRGGDGAGADRGIC